jgi:hypothetical protein
MDMNILQRLLLPGVFVVLLASAAPAAHVVSAEGEVERGRGEPAVWSALAAGDALDPGDRVRTGEDGRAELRLGRSDIRLYPDSVLRVPVEMSPGDDPAAVRLEEGVSLFDVRPAPKPFEVRTPEVVVSVKGTRFSVALGTQSASVAVYRGSVGVRSLALESAREVLVREGFAASGAESFQLDSVDQADPWEAFGGAELPDVWQADDLGAAGGPASPAMESVHAAARAEAVVFAADRHPQVRERIERAHAARLRERGLDPQAADAVTQAATSPEMLAAIERDGVAEIRERMEAMNEEYVETWMNGGMPGGSDGGSHFDVKFIQAEDPYLEVLYLASGETWSLHRDFFEGILDGSTVFPTTLMTLLDSQGIEDPTLFASQMLALFENIEN